MKFDYSAEIDLKAELSLDDMAKQLTEVFRGFDFIEDTEDRFDEVPAYIAIICDFEIVLFGHGGYKRSDYYFLQISTDDEVDLLEYKTKHEGVELFSFLSESEVVADEYGCKDVSKDILKYLKVRTNIYCRIAETE